LADTAKIDAGITFSTVIMSYFCSLEEAEGRGGEQPPRVFRQHSERGADFPYNGADESEGQDFLFCSPFSAQPQNGKNSASQVQKGGDLRQQILPVS